MRGPWRRPHAVAAEGSGHFIRLRDARFIIFHYFCRRIMTLFDTILALVAAAAAITGYRRGLVGQLASLAGMAAGFAACYAVGDEATALLRAVNPACEQWPGAGATVPAVAHCVLFLLVMLTVRVAGLFVKNVAGKWGVTSLADRLGGVALSALVMLVIG